MAQKVNPIAVRLGLNRKSDSSWFSDYYYATLFFQDFHLRNSLNSLKQPSGFRFGLRTAKCIIHHYPKKSCIHLFCLGGAKRDRKNSYKGTDGTKMLKFNVGRVPYPLAEDRPLIGSPTYPAVGRLRAAAWEAVRRPPSLGDSKEGVSRDRNQADVLSPRQKDAIKATAGRSRGDESQPIRPLEVVDGPPKFFNDRRPFYQLAVEKLRLSSCGFAHRKELTALEWPTLNAALTTLFLNKKVSGVRRKAPSLLRLVHHFCSSSGWTSIACKDVIKTTTTGQFSNSENRQSLITAKPPSANNIPSVVPWGEARETRQPEPSSTSVLENLVAKPGLVSSTASIRSSELPFHNFVARAVFARTSFSELGAGNYLIMQYFQKSKTCRLASRGLILRQPGRLPSPGPNILVRDPEDVSQHINRPNNKGPVFQEVNWPTMVDPKGIKPATDKVESALGAVSALRYKINGPRRRQATAGSAVACAVSFVGGSAPRSCTVDQREETSTDRAFMQATEGLKGATVVLPLRASDRQGAQSAVDRRETSDGATERQPCSRTSIEGPWLTPLTSAGLTTGVATGSAELRATLQNLSFRANCLQLSVVQSRHYYLSNLQNLLWNHTNTLTSIKPIQVTSIYQSASLVAQDICYQLEQTKSFRQICKTILKEIEQRKYIKGIRIACSGRLNGAEIAKTECKKYGETSLHVFSDLIDYAAKPAYTPYGILGVKVWISYLQ